MMKSGDLGAVATIKQISKHVMMSIRWSCGDILQKGLELIIITVLQGIGRAECAVAAYYRHMLVEWSPGEHSPYPV
jgi:hypothetical protein